MNENLWMKYKDNLDIKRAIERLNNNKTVIDIRYLLYAMIANDLELVKLLVNNAIHFQVIEADEYYEEDEYYEVDDYYEEDDEDNEDEEDDEDNEDEEDEVQSNRPLNIKDYFPEFDLDNFIEKYRIKSKIYNFVTNQYNENKLIIVNPVRLKHNYEGSELLAAYRMNESQIIDFLYNYEDAEEMYSILDNKEFYTYVSGGEIICYDDEFNKSVKNYKGIKERIIEDSRKVGNEIYDITKQDGFYSLRIDGCISNFEGYFLPNDYKEFDRKKLTTGKDTFIFDRKIEFIDADYHYNGKKIQFIAENFHETDHGYGYRQHRRIYQVKNGVCNCWYASDAHYYLSDKYKEYYKFHPEVINLFAEPQKINEFIFDGKLALIESIYYDNFVFVEKLIELGADVNLKDKFGNFPLIEAVNQENLELTKMLVEKGADVNQVNNDGKTALKIAKDKRYSEIVKYLTAR